MKTAIITGGVGFERPISLRSAQAVAGWIPDSVTYVFPEDLEKFLAERSSIDLVVPMIHGVGGEDGALQGLCEHLNMPYIFSGIEAHAIGLDKVRTKQLAGLAGVPIARRYASVEEVTGPVFAKPQFGGSTENSQVCESREVLQELLDSNPNTDFIIEDCVRGREFTVGVVEYNGELKAMPPIEIVAKDGLFDFESKYNPEKLAKEICPADITPELDAKLRAQAVTMHEMIGARHLSRSDFIVQEDGTAVFLEINTIPGMTATSFIPNFIHHIGLTMKDALSAWSEEALARAKR